MFRVWGSLGDQTNAMLPLTKTVFCGRQLMLDKDDKPHMNSSTTTTGHFSSKIYSEKIHFGFKK